MKLSWLFKLTSSIDRKLVKRGQSNYIQIIIGTAYKLVSMWMFRRIEHSLCYRNCITHLQFNPNSNASRLRLNRLCCFPLHCKIVGFICLASHHLITGPCTKQMYSSSKSYVTTAFIYNVPLWWENYKHLMIAGPAWHYQPSYHIKKSSTLCTEIILLQKKCTPWIIYIY